MKTLTTAIVVCLALAATGCGDDDSSNSEPTTAPSSATSGAEASNRSKPKVTVPDAPPPKRLLEKDLIEGSGPVAKAGAEVTVHYVGVGYESGREFDASWDGGEPFTFSLGAGEVIPGWDQGVAGMRVGGRRELTVPADLAYGKAGFPPAIGPDETLVFVVDLLEAN